MISEVLGIPVVMAPSNSHRLHPHWLNNCPHDEVHDPHIHLGADYGDETIDLTGFGPGILHLSSVDALDDPYRWTYASTPAVPSWWDRFRGRTLDAALLRMARRLLATAARHRRAAEVLDDVVERTYR